jgi:hypothetical protein
MTATVQILPQVVSAPVPSAIDLIAFLLSRKGHIVTVNARRKMKVRAKIAQVVEKESIFQAQVGVNYDNKKSVIEKRESGELPAENAGLPWGEWLQLPYVITHKGKLYFRFSTVKNSFIPSVRYFIDGKEAEKSEVVPLCLGSEFTEKEDRDCFTFHLGDILSAK